MIAHNFNPSARVLKLNSSSVDNPRGNSTPDQVSASPSPYLEARLLDLDVAHADMRSELGTLEDLYQGVYTDFGMAKDYSRDTYLVTSRQSTLKSKQKLEQLSRKVHESVNGDANEQKANGGSVPKARSSLPPHMSAASIASQGCGQKSLPPHLRGRKLSGAFSGNPASSVSIDTRKHQHEPLVTDGPIDTIIRQPAIPAAAPSPPLSPSKTGQGDTPYEEVETLCSNNWKPYHLTTLANLPAEIRARIPAKQDMATFTFDMLQNTFGGIAWSPGLRFINTTSATLLQNRTYYMLDPRHEPYLPKAPGEHGAKLTAFFNKAPEEEFDNLPEGTNSYTDVPLFIQVLKGRYSYFGNYSQTRWSDKLDNDTMKARVPQQVKEHIAKDLAATPREDWVTRELKKHFFPKPEYAGAVLIPTSDEITVNTTYEERHNEQVASDVKSYVQELAEWEREANMKTAMIKPDFILDAFNAADADEPPGLRLCWEYLQCVDWKRDFYNMLVGFQARTDNPK